MKIRMGFVSNSSSTSYVIAVTRDFKPSPENIDKFIKECEEPKENSPKMTTEQAIEVIKGIIDALCEKGEWSWSDGLDISELDERLEYFYQFKWTFLNDILVSEEDGGLGSYFCHNILADDIQNKLKKYVKLCKCEEKKNENS